MLETIRDYALSQLEASGERELIRRRHAGYYLSGADVPVAQMKLSQQAKWLESLEARQFASRPRLV